MLRNQHSRQPESHLYMPAVAIMFAHSPHMYWQLHAALGLEALVVGKGPEIHIKQEIIYKYIF